MHDILKALAEVQGWVFEYGRSDFQNLHDAAEQKETVYLFLDPVEIRKNRNADDGTIISTSYSGSFMLLYSSDIDEISYEDRYQKYIKPIVLNHVDTIEEAIICDNAGTIEEFTIKEVINMFDFNLDGLLIPYKVTFDE